ncbi:MAG TPA: alpha/beta fold hydrolase [Myxococcales bacterium]|jgi:pimeloyl-ACP methyl ester carboxylesterase
MTSRVLALAASASLLLSGCALARLYHEPLPPEAEVLQARTDDGWNIALIHYRPAGPPTGLPVLLCHGISANGRNMDLDAQHSLARWFAARGREAFAMSLRGNGGSDYADEKAGRSPAYSMDTYATQDVPAALRKVREVTGAAQVDYVGHSMGGLIGYIYLARGGQGFHAATFLGSPTRFAWGRDLERRLRDAGGVLGGHLTTVDVPLLANVTAPIHGDVRTYADTVLYNPDNVPAPLWKKFMSTGVGSISGAVLQQFTLWLEKDAMVSADGAIDYYPALAKVTTPVLVVAGKLDRTAPVAGVKSGYDALGGPKRFFVAGEQNGFRYDYGHMDLVIGDRASVELWPRVLAFFEASR